MIALNEYIFDILITPVALIIASLNNSVSKELISGSELNRRVSVERNIPFNVLP